MRTVYKQKFTSGSWAWNHKPVHSYHLEVVAAERRYQHVGPHKPSVQVVRGHSSKYRGNENPRAQEQFEQVYKSHQAFVRRHVAAVLPKAAVPEVCSEVWQRYWVNLRNVAMPDTLLIPSLVRGIKWTLHVAIKSWKRRESFKLDVLAPDHDDDEMIRSHQEYWCYEHGDHSLSSLYETDLHDAVKKLPKRSQEYVRRRLENSRATSTQSVKAQVERQLSQLLSDLDR